MVEAITWAAAFVLVPFLIGFIVVLLAAILFAFTD